MKKRKERKDKENIEHRGNNNELLRQFQLELDVVHHAPKSYYTKDGEMKHVTSKRNR